MFSNFLKKSIFIFYFCSWTWRFFIVMSFWACLTKIHFMTFEDWFKFCQSYNLNAIFDFNIALFFCWLFMLSFCIFFLVQRNIYERAFKLSLFFGLSSLFFCFNSITFINNFNSPLFSVEFIVNSKNLAFIKKSELFIAYFGYDALSLWFVFITFFIFPFCFYYLFDEKKSVSLPTLFCFNLFFLQFCLYISFISFNLLIFYFCFESALVPMYLIITLWGNVGWRKYKAGNYFYIYTTVFSSLILFACYHFANSYGTLNIFLFPEWARFDNSFLMNLSWWCLFIGFAVKIPIFPLHLWLLEAHVEAPTVGSVILASLLLKLGTYGLVRFVLVCFNLLSFSFAPFVFAFSICSMIYCSLLAIYQIDLKKIIAYSSIVHMNFSVLGFFSGTKLGFIGGLVMNISHAFVSAGLFFLIGILYRRFNTRLISNLSGLYRVMPLFTIYFFLFMLANLGFPLTIGFISELLIFMGLCSTNFLSLIGLGFCGFVFVSNLVYCIWTVARLCFGSTNFGILRFVYIYDLSQREFILLNILFSLILILGVKPNILVSICEIASFQLFI